MMLLRIPQWALAALHLVFAPVLVGMLLAWWWFLLSRMKRSYKVT